MVVVKRRNALARLIICFSGHAGLAKKRVGGQAGKVQLSCWVVVVVKRRNALARLMICFSDKPGWLRSGWADRPVKCISPLGV